MARTGYFGHVAITLGGLRGVTNSDPALEVELRIRADGFAPGVTAMILPTAFAQGSSLNTILGQAEVIITQLGFRPDEGGGKPYATSEYARWRLSQAAIENLESVRNGGKLTLYVTPMVILLNHGEPLTDEHPRPQGAIRPNVYPYSPIWHAPQETLEVTAETWAHLVLAPWQQAAALTLIVKLPVDEATDDHRTVIRELNDARRRLDAGDWKGSIRASRDAAEVLRSMHPDYINPNRIQRTVDEREAAIIDSELELIKALYAYESATHPDPGLRTVVWTREHAILALTATAAIAQRIFSAMTH